MRRIIAPLGILVVGVGLGLLFGSEMNSLHAYRSPNSLAIYHRTGHVGVLPAGTIYLSRHRLTNNWDQGWWGCVPIGFPSEGRALDMGLTPMSSVTFDEYFSYGAEVVD